MRQTYLLKSFARIFALLAVLQGLSGCAALFGPRDAAQTEVARLEAAHGDSDRLRRYFDTHTEGEIRSELAKFGIGYLVHGETLEELRKAELQSLAECPKYFPATDRAKWHNFNGEFYYIDSAGRPSKAYANLPPIKMEPRQNACQTAIGQWGDAENPNQNYDGGHLIGSQLGGWGGRANIVPQNANFNRGNWAQLENKMATCAVLATAAMRYSINVIYGNSSSLTPEAFVMTITRRSDGVKVALRFANEPGGGSNGTQERLRGAKFLTDNGCIEPD